MSRLRSVLCRALIPASLCLLATLGYATALRAEEIFSRSISIANETVGVNAWSRSSAIANEPGGVQVDSRSLSIFNETSPAYAAARSVSIVNEQSVASAYSPTVSLFNDTTAPNASARSVSVLNSPLVIVTDVFSRGVTLWNDVIGANANSRQFSVRNDRTIPTDGGACSAGAVVFRWPATAGATTYRLQVATAPNAQSIVLTTDVVADTFLVYNSGTDGQTYYAQKSVSFNNGLTFGDPSGFSDGIRIDRTPPSCSIPVGRLVDATHVAFSYQGADQGHSIVFQTQIGTDPAIGTPVVDIVLGEGVQEYSLSATPGSTYYARARAIDCAGNESAWSAVSPGLFVANLPDLVIGTVTAPPTATSDATIGVTWQVRNPGTGSTSVSSWIERVYLSPDTLLSQLTSLGDFPNLSYLLAGESYSRSVTVQIPRGISGNYYLVVLVDANNNQPEANEANNRARSTTPTSVTLQNFANLVVTNVGAADLAIAGDSISVVWTVKNTGNKVTEVPDWQDQVFLSADSTLTYAFGQHYPSGDVIVFADPLKTVRHQGVLMPGDQYTATGRFALPYPLTEGLYYITIATDWASTPEAHFFLYHGNVFEHTEELANWRSDATNISLPPTPDLVVTSLQPPGNVTAGQSAYVTWTVDNIGGGNPPEASWSDRLYISTSPDFNAQNATSLGDFLQLSDPPISPGGRADTPPLGSLIYPYSKSALVRIPNGYQGTHYFHAFTDVQNGVFENGADSNNVATSLAFNVTLPPSPDLRIDFVTSTPTGQAGDSTTVIYQVTNTGSAIASATSWTDQIQIVRLDEGNNPILGSDRTLKNLSRTQAMATGATYQTSERVLLPADLGAGTYAMKVQVDQGDAIYENAPEATNTAMGQTVTIQAYPAIDLIVEEIMTSATATAGDSLAVTWRVKNVGAGRTIAGWWKDGVYLSLDAHVDPQDVTLGVFGRSTYSILEPNQTYTMTRWISLPPDWAGQASLLVAADVGNGVRESNEANNESAKTIAVALPSLVDLVVDSLNVSGDLVAGQPAHIRARIHNAGVGTLSSRTWYDDLYISPKPILDGQALRISQWRGAHNIGANAAYWDSVEVTIANYLSGDMFLIGRADALNDVYEPGAESNNLAVLPVRLAAQPLCDLQPEGVEAADSAYAGRDLELNWEVRNNGPGAISGMLRQGAFLSMDTTWDASDQLLEVLDTLVAIEPEATHPTIFKMHISATAVQTAVSRLGTVLPGALPGDYHLIIRTDLSNAFRETNESNNTSASSSRIALGLITLHLGETASDSLSSTHWSYFQADPGVDSDLKLTISIPGYLGQITIFGSSQVFPTASTFEWVTSGAGPSTALTIPAVGTSRIYFAVHAESVSDTTSQHAAVAALLEPLPLVVESVTPLRVGSGRQVTTELKGSGFRDSCSVLLRHQLTGVTVAAQRVLRMNSLQLRATWNLAGALHGPYDVLVAVGSDTAHFTSILVESPTGYVLEDQTSTPDGFRTGARTAYTVRFKNTGNIDIPFALATITLPEGASVSLADEDTGVFVPAAYAISLDSLSNRGRGVVVQTERVLTSGGPAAQFTGVLYDLAPGATREVLLYLSISKIGTASIATNVAVQDASAYFRGMTQIGALYREVVRANPQHFASSTVAIAADSVAFLRAFLHMMWDQRDPMKASELIELAGTVASPSAPLGVDHAPVVYSQSPTSDASDPFEGSHARRGARLSPRARVNLNSDPCVKCPTTNGPCYPSGTDYSTGYVDPLGNPECYCSEYYYSKNTCETQLRLACGVVVGTATFAVPATKVAQAAGAAIGAGAGTFGCNYIPLDAVCNKGDYYICVCRPMFRSCDPNEIIGPSGQGEKKWVSPSAPLRYRINFENDPVLASAPAQQVSISAEFPPTLDPRTLRLIGFGFDGQEWSIPGERSFYSTRVVPRGNDQLAVDVASVLSTAQGRLTWTFATVDQRTGLPPSDPLSGFLAVNDSTGRGQGYVEFEAQCSPGTETGAPIDMGSLIVFDTNPGVATNRVRNTVDSAGPSSHVLTLPELAADGNIDVSWTAEDDAAGSEVASVSLYSSKDEGTFGLVASGLSAPPFKFEGEVGHVYSFYSVARDTAGNSEGAKNVAEATVRFTGSAIVWPGDTNNDSYVDEFDVLPLGRYFDLQGPARDSVSVRWTPREVTGWVNRKAAYADANGDGRVNQNDLLAVGLNFGRRWKLSPWTRPPEHIAEISLGGFATGSSIEVQVDLDAAQAADVVGGAALRLNYPPDYLEPVSVSAISASGDEVITFLKSEAAAGRCSIALAGMGEAAHLLLGKEGHLTLTLTFRTKAVPAKGATVSIERCEALVGGEVTRDVNVSLSSDFAVDRPGVVRLLQNTPNPFATRTVFQFELPKAGEVSLQVFDVAGRLVASPINRARMNAGVHQVGLDGSDWASGIYFTELHIGSNVRTRKMLVLR